MMLNRPFACISDIHGNMDAFRAVLTEIAQRAITDILVAGDLLYGGEHPQEVWQALQEIHARCVQGPSDKALYELCTETTKPHDEQERAALDRFHHTKHALGELVILRLKRLPLSLRFPMLDGSELLLVHGSPLDPFEEISIDLEDEEVLRLVNDDPADIIVCGASHVPFQRFVDNVQVINVGSVGQAPEGRVAHLTVMIPKSSGTDVEQLWVPY